MWAGERRMETLRGGLDVRQKSTVCCPPFPRAGSIERLRYVWYLITLRPARARAQAW